jgi:TolA-binding protein
MFIVLSMFLFVTQGLGGAQTESGTVIGTVRDVSGKPMAGVPVAAITANVTPATACLASLTESQTDSEGKYRLSVRPGRYYVFVRLMDRTTYFPAAPFREESTSVAIATATVDNVNLTVPNANSGTGGRERELYGRAVEDLKLDCLSVARHEFQAFFETYDDSELSSDAKYFYAESWYREGTPAALTLAQREYTLYITFFPDAPKTAEARKRLADIQQR